MSSGEKAINFDPLLKHIRYILFLYSSIHEPKIYKIEQNYVFLKVIIRLNINENNLYFFKNLIEFYDFFSFIKNVILYKFKWKYEVKEIKKMKNQTNECSYATVGEINDFQVNCKQPQFPNPEIL